MLVSAPFHKNYKFSICKRGSISSRNRKRNVPLSRNLEQERVLVRATRWSCVLIYRPCTSSAIGFSCRRQIFTTHTVLTELIALYGLKSSQYYFSVILDQKNLDCIKIFIKIPSKNVELHRIIPSIGVRYFYSLFWISVCTWYPRYFGYFPVVSVKTWSLRSTCLSFKLKCKKHAVVFIFNMDCSMINSAFIFPHFLFSWFGMRV